MRALRNGMLAVALVCLAASTVRADDAVQPWVADTALVKAVWSDIHDKGILSVATRLADLERALAGAKDSIAAASTQNIVLTDGAAESLMAMALVAGDKTHPHSGTVTAVENPYPQIGMLLGSYYDEIGKPAEAARVLEAGIDADAIEGLHAGDTYPMLQSEHGIALGSLHRWPEALAAYDAALEASQDDDKDGKAIIQRGRGYVLTELNRLDDAEAAYNESLKLQPGNALALHELDYIKGLRAGKPEAPSGGIRPLQPPAAPQQTPPSQDRT